MDNRYIEIQPATGDLFCSIPLGADWSHIFFCGYINAAFFVLLYILFTLVCFASTQTRPFKYKGDSCKPEAIIYRYNEIYPQSTKTPILLFIFIFLIKSKCYLKSKNARRNLSTPLTAFERLQSVDNLCALSVYPWDFLRIVHFALFSKPFFMVLSFFNSKKQSVRLSSSRTS